MASIKFITKGIKNPSNLYVRFYHSKDFDVTIKTGILINAKHWNNKLQRFKTIAEEIPDKDLITSNIEKIRAHIISEYNKSFNNGEIITKRWIETILNKYNNRPKEGADHESYFLPFVEKYIKESSERVNPSTGKKISLRTIRKYNTTLERLKEYEEEHKLKLTHNEINLRFHRKFTSLLVDKSYGASTIEKYISQIKTFCREAESSGLNISPEFKHRNFTFKKSKPLDPYLNIAEIQSIFDLEIEDPIEDNIRDLFIVGLWTGLRVSDFKELSRVNIVGDDILISSTVKTNAPAKIPIHPQVKSILNKRNGNLPRFDLSPKALELFFNKKIKVIASKAGINQKIIGDKRDKETNRNVRDLYPKCDLISSHICRRSFVTNHYGKIPNQAIMAITTHSSEKQLLDYVKISNDQYVEMVRDHWEEQEVNSTMKIVS